MAFTALKLEKHRCNVYTLEGSKIHCEVANLTLGIDLLTYACKKLDLIETNYFGLKYKHHNDRKYSWLQTNKFIGRQLHGKVYELDLHVKYWPSSPYMVEIDITRYQMVLELREKLLNGDLACPSPIQALLASYLMQAEFGDFEDITTNDNYNDCIQANKIQFYPNQQTGFWEKVKEFHRKHHDLTPAASELFYLENARKISLYGMELHEVLDADGISVILGVNFEGVHIIQNGTILNNMFWPNIVEVKSKQTKKALFLKLKQSDFHIKIGFTSPTLVEWKRLHRCCRDQLAFFNACMKPEEELEFDDTDSGTSKNDPNIRYSQCHDLERTSFVRIKSMKFIQNKKKKLTEKSSKQRKLEEEESKSKYEQENDEYSKPLLSEEETSSYGLPSSETTSNNSEYDRGDITIVTDISEVITKLLSTENVDTSSKEYVDISSTEYDDIPTINIVTEDGHINKEETATPECDVENTSLQAENNDIDVVSIDTQNVALQEREEERPVEKCAVSLVAIDNLEASFDLSFISSSTEGESVIENPAAKTQKLYREPISSAVDKNNDAEISIGDVDNKPIVDSVEDAAKQEMDQPTSNGTAPKETTDPTVEEVYHAEDNETTD